MTRQTQGVPRVARGRNKRLVLSRLFSICVLAAALLSRPVYPDDSFLAWMLGITGYLALVVGSCTRAWSAVFIAGHKNARVVTEGPYSIVRHPLYLGNLLAFLGAGLLLQSFVLSLALAVAFAITHWPAMRAEERHLTERFGARYVAYTHSVPAFVPAPSHLQTPATLVVDVKVLTRMLFEAALVMLVLPLAEGIRLLHQLHLVPTVLHLW